MFSFQNRVLNQTPIFVRTSALGSVSVLIPVQASSLENVYHVAIRVHWTDACQCKQGADCLLCRCLRTENTYEVEVELKLSVYDVFPPQLVVES